MFFKTDDECRALAIGMGFDAKNLPANEPARSIGTKAVRLQLDNPRPATAALAQILVSCLGPFRSSLLWVTQYGIWPSSENRHLYYRVRLSYSDHRDLPMAPGHYCLGHEASDLVTFVDLVIQFGWGGHLLVAPKTIYMYISHDGWAHIESERELDQIAKMFESRKLRYELQE